MGTNRSNPYKHFSAFDDESKNWQSSSSPSSPSSTQGLPGNNNGDHHHHHHPHHQQQQNRRGGSSRRFTVPFAKKIDWSSLWGKSKAWIRSPLNLALSIWILAVAVSGAILFMVMTGMLNRALPTKARRDAWFEANNQILNALFTLMCLVQHPRRCYHLALLCRWRAPGDVLTLRQAYCKGGECKPGERRHMAVVVLLLHLNCLAQYALCGLNLGYPRSRRPPVGVGITIAVAIGAPAVAGLYNNLSPLGRDYDAHPPPDDEESQTQQSDDQRTKVLEKRRSSAPSRRGGGGEEGGGDPHPHHPPPQWVGGLFDIWDDLSLAYLSMFCTCCVFGWNASRLGFGNMYVHVATFALFCAAPFFILTLAAVNIDDERVRDALGLGGVLLCVLGLLYGGFWRIQMRRRFGLPATNAACCGKKPDVADCLQWLCCYSCALAQEVRTADAYEVVQDRLYERRRDDDGDSSGSTTSQQQQHRTLQDQLSTVQQPIGFADLSSAQHPVATAARPVSDGVTVPPSVAVIQKH